MSVYVDDMEASFGRMKMCHMVADTTVELLDMADKIGVQRKWIQHPGTHREHFDICKSKRTKAVQCGAREISQRELGELLVYWRTGEKPRPLQQAQQQLQDLYNEPTKPIT